MKVTLPPELAPGEYTLVASGKDTATTRLTVTAAAQPSHPAEAPHAAETHAEHETAPAHAEAEGAHGAGGHEVEARDEPMDLPRSRGAGEVAVAWATILLSAAIGAALLMRAQSRG